MEAGLFVGGFLLVGVGTAHADGGGMAPPPNQPLLAPVTQVLDGGGALGSLASTITSLTGSTTSPSSVPSTPATTTTTTTSTTVAPTPQPAPAPTAPTTRPPLPTEPKPVQAKPGDSGCVCAISTGTPTVNGKSAGAHGTAAAPVAQPATISVPVSNTGMANVTGLAATGPDGDLTCASTTLAPGEAATCSGSYTPELGDQAVPITVAGSTSDGGNATSTGLLFVTGLVGAGTQTSGGASGSTTPAGSTSGTNGEPVDTTGSTSPTAGNTSSETCHCVLTAGTPNVAGKAAGAPGTATAPTGTPSSLTIPVSNTGTEPVSDLSATSTEGPLTCASSELAPAESTSCTGSLTPESGDQVVPIQVSGTTPDGSNAWTEGAAFVTGTPSGTQQTDGNDGTPDGSTTPTDGTNGTPTTGTDGSTTPGTTDGTATPDTTPGNGTDGTDGSTTPGTTPGDGIAGTNGSTTPSTTDGTDGSTTPDGTGSSTTPGTTSGTDGTTTPGTTPGDGTDGTDGTNEPGTTPGTTDGTDGATTPDTTGGSTGTTDGSTTPTDGTNGTPTTGSNGTDGSTTPGTTDGTATPDTTPGNGTDGTDGTSTDPALKISDLTVNGRSAGAPGSAKAVADRPAAVSFVVSNTADDAVQGLSGRVGSNDVTCTETDLAPGETATCEGRLSPRVGDQAAPITMSGTLPDGRTAETSRSVYLSGVAPAQAAPVDSAAGSVGTPAQAGSVGQAAGSNGGVASSAGSGNVALGGVPAPTGVQQFVDPSRGAFPIPLGAVSAGGGGTAQQASAHTTQPTDSQHDRLPWVLLAAGIGAFGLRRLLPIRSR
jgi:hypothetical protein